MKNPGRMLSLADDPSALSALTGIFRERTSLLDVLRATGRATRIRELGSLIEGTGDASTNLRLMHSICRQFDVDILHDFFNKECRNHIGSPLYGTPGRFFVKPPLAGMVIYKDEFVDVHYIRSMPLLAVAEAQLGAETGITINGADSLVLFVDACTVEHQVYDVRASDGLEAQLHPLARSRSSSGEPLFLEGGRQGMHLLHGSGSTSMIVCLSAAPRSEVTQHFSIRTGRLVGCTAANVTDSRLQIIATALSNMPGTGNSKSLLDLSHHPTTFVRWGAIRSLYQIDPRAASERLREMRESDENEEIRTLAARSLEQG